MQQLRLDDDCWHVRVNAQEATFLVPKKPQHQTRIGVENELHGKCRELIETFPGVEVVQSDPRVHVMIVRVSADVVGQMQQALSSLRYATMQKIKVTPTESPRDLDS